MIHWWFVDHGKLELLPLDYGLIIIIGGAFGWAICEQCKKE
jgi:hypothetical protein